MRNSKGWLGCVMAVAVGVLVLGSPLTASADFTLALVSDGGAFTPVATGPEFVSLNTSGILGDFAYTFFSSTAENSAGGSNLLSSTTQIRSLSSGTHTLEMYVSNTGYTLPTDTELAVKSGMGGTYGVGMNYTAGATFQMWADATNADFGMPVPFTNGLQVAIPASGSGTTFNTGPDPTGIFTRLDGPYSLTTLTKIVTTGVGDMNYSTHVYVAAVPEPGLLLIGLMGAGLMGLYIGARRKS